MKRLFLIISIVLLLGLTACDMIEYVDNSSTEMNISTPNQEMLLVLIRNYSSEKSHANASVIDINGGYHSLPEDFSFTDSDWQQTLSTATKTEVKRNLDNQHLKNVYQFINEFDIYVSDIKTYDYTVWDYGTRDLYAIYTNSDNSIGYKLLCKFGETTQCINSEDVREFINWMIDNQYFDVIGDFKY